MDQDARHVRHVHHLRRFFFVCDGEELSCCETTAPDPSGGGPIVPGPSAPGTTAVVLHGAGTSDKERLGALMADFAAYGCRAAVALDFSGHGGSSGSLGELSLRRRFTQARAVIDARVPPRDRLVLVGFSMSGQTVADLAAHYGPRVAALGLCAPAVYARRAWPVPFGSGFTGIIRTPESWRDSAALDTFRVFTARAVLLVPAEDAVIPPEVTSAVAEALGARADFTHLVHDGASHRLGLWLRDNPVERRGFVEALLSASGGT